ncbi:conserved hypothetical protein [uncultured Mycobacterium sp.]|uniref:Uncharacterized protein n=1 Tax=uncultured Mycobacterium sp. TaxID=171292 RepID=A0A1Y5PF77_9MYCO|nr:conserved hypothetical protein [uncultured Mycobacterium sp.]
MTAVVDLHTIRGVELIKAGTWQPDGIEGDWTVTPEHLAAAIEAHRAGLLRKPVVKIGHTDPRFDGGPALGFVDNLRLADGGSTLVADLVNVPGPVAKLLPHAYPDRSIEALIDFTDQAGTVWPLVLTGLALLGAADPAVETLQSLQDVGALYGEQIAARRVVLATNHGAPDRTRAVAVAAARRRRTHRVLTQPKGEACPPL